MRNEKMSAKTRGLFIGIAAVLCSIVILPKQTSLFAQNDSVEMQGEAYADQTNTIMNVDKDGNVTYNEIQTKDITDDLSVSEQTTYEVKGSNQNEEVQTIAQFDTFEEANAVMQRRSLMRESADYVVYDNDRVRAVSIGVVNFRTKSSGTNTMYTEDATGIDGYTNGSSAADAAFLGTNSDGTNVKFKLAGVVGWVKADDVEIIPYDNANSVSFYRCEGGRIYHYVSSNITSSYYPSTYDVGPQQGYMLDNVVYYSYDGHYFYTSYATMIQDYKNNTYQNSINLSTPYYNYYQYLTQRTKTNFSGVELDNRVVSIVGNNASALKNVGAEFIKAQDTYGANALLTFGLAVNESGWGQSSYAINRNNIFGHAAYDSNPDNASTYKSVADSIKQHAKVYVSESYLDPNDYSGRYHGGHLGDKQSGMNVSYASDPYWGEKAASQGYYMERYMNTKKDYGQYTIGIKKGNTNVPIYKEASTNSTRLYRTGIYGNYPFIILASMEGEAVNGNTTWYKIQSDSTLNSDRTGITQDKGEYDISTYYAYVNASYVDYIVGKQQIQPEKPNDTETPSPDPSPSPEIKKGDVNGDGKITSMDYVLVKNHILGIGALINDSAIAADVNGDGKITSTDYVLIKNHILGISKIN